MNRKIWKILSFTIFVIVIITLGIIFGWNSYVDQRGWRCGRPTDVALRHELSRIALSLMFFHEKNGYIPENEDGLYQLLIKKPFVPTIENTITVREDKTKNGALVLDRWETPIKYICFKETGLFCLDEMNIFALYSCGENGIDENGKGDDIFYTTYVYWSDREGCFMIDYEAKAAGIPTDEYRKTHPWQKEEKKNDSKEMRDEKEKNKEPDKPNEPNK